jgi:hypothetical protein
MGWIRKRPDRPTPWRAGYRGPDGREHSRAFDRKVDAERWLRDELQKQDRGLWVDPSAGAVRFEEYAEEWFRGLVLKPRRSQAIDRCSTHGSCPRWDRSN